MVLHSEQATLLHTDTYLSTLFSQVALTSSGAQVQWLNAKNRTADSCVPDLILACGSNVNKWVSK